MQDRFKFNAIVTGYYDIDTPYEYSEFEPQIYLENVDIWSGGDIGVSRDDLELAIKNQYPNIQKSQFNQIMKFFEDNSNSSDNEAYLTISPHKIIQCTGVKDKNGNLIYEGDIVSVEYEGRKYIATIDYDEDDTGFGCNYHFRENGELYSIATMGIYGTVIDNIYQNQEPIERDNPDDK